MSDEWKHAYQELNQKYAQKCAELTELRSQLQYEAEGRKADIRQLDGIISNLEKKIKACAKCRDNKVFRVASE